MGSAKPLGFYVPDKFDLQVSLDWSILIWPLWCKWAAQLHNTTEVYKYICNNVGFISHIIL